MRACRKTGNGNFSRATRLFPRDSQEKDHMRKILIASIASLAIVSLPATAMAGERTVTGAAIGAGAGALVAGPVGAVVGGGIGAWVGGPRITRSSAHKRCWRDNAGVRHCHWR
jgi:osmotically inducible lipoprotein OsmB